MISELCKLYNIKNYTINSDNTIDVDGDVSLSNYQLDEIPLNFNKVTGHFIISYLGIKSLKGSPKWVGGDFICNLTSIKNLEHGPKKVQGTFEISNNKYLTSLKGGPDWVGRNFYCSHTKINKLEYSPKYIAGDVCITNTNIETLEGLPKHIKGNLNCSENYLTTLKGGPEKIDGNFISSYTQLINLNGIADCKGNIILNNNQLTEIKGIKLVKKLNLSYNQLTEKSLQDLPKDIELLSLNSNKIKDVYFLKDLNIETLKMYKNPINEIIGFIESKSDLDKINIFNLIKPYKNDKLSLKRTKYLWSLLYKDVNENRIKERIDILRRNYDLID